MMNKGFTLIETIVALAIISFVFIGIFSLINTSLNMIDYAKKKLVIYKAGFERFIKSANYPAVLLPDVEKVDGYKLYFKTKSSPSGVYMVQQITLIIECEGVKDSFVYYKFYR